ncbi:retrovirus-related Pol polyprotein from transposon 297 [Trichonephila clavipes]|nr:retrovirus-related Pol polyprotein from transposon 297 [Trichonephila clavipes]
MSPVKKQIEDLLEKDIIEECESPYGAPVVLIPKPNYQFRLSNFSEIARPLSNLTKKKASWKWSKEEEKAFQTLKQCLVSPPILKQAGFSQPFLIRTHSSNYALGAVLLQGEDKEHPVEFASRLLNPAEINYSTTEREALAVVWALNKFRGYIDGASITVASDHQPLRWLMKLKSPTGRLARWALPLQSFNLNMEYIPRKSNVVADMLSRPACHEENELCEVCTVAIDVQSRFPKEIRDEQMKDEELVKIISCLEDPDKNVNYVNWVELGYLMNQGVLLRYAPDSESEDAQLVKEL